MTEPAPEAIQDLATACVRFVEGSLKIELDYTPDTLPLLDHYLREAGSKSRDEAIALVAPAAGAYFGEVVRRSMGPCRWYTGGDYDGYRIEFEPCFLHFNPMGQALEAIRQGDVEGWNAALTVTPEDTRAVKAALERFGEVRDDDYYRLAVRHEILEQVLTALIGQSVSRSEGGNSIGPETYASNVAEAAAQLEAAKQAKLN